MATVSRRQLYVMAWTILLIVLLLLAFISVSTYQNLDRERKVAVETIHRQALALITALEAGARVGMMMQMTGKDAIGNLVHEISRSDDISYLYLVNAEGKVVHHSIPSLVGTRAVWRPEFEKAGEIRSRKRHLDNGTHIYEVAKPFTPIGAQSSDIRLSTQDSASDNQVHFHARAIVYLGMTMVAYEAARKSDLQHAMVMAGIVLALGGGVIYFFIVIRSYYLISQALKKTRDYTRQVIASMAHGVISIDPTGKIISYNQQALSLLDIAETDISQFDLGTVFDFRETGIAQTISQGVPVLNREIRYHRGKSAQIPLLLTVTPIKDEANIRSGAVVVLRDLTEIRRLEAQIRRAEKLAAVGRLAAGVAHEIRNPLSSIRGFAYLLGRGYEKETSEREYADVMVREIDRINRVVTDLLNFSHPLTLELELTTLPDLIDHVVSLVSGDVNTRSITVQVHCSTDLQPFSLDPNQITQALLNLMLNAISAVEDGGNIEIRAGGSKGNTAYIYVEDDGAGIDPGNQENIFEPFYTTKDRGTGLGLAMVRKIVENHEGSVTVESPPSGKRRGTRVTLFFRNMEGNKN